MQAGDSGFIKREILVSGIVAFTRNQQVTVEKVDPNPERPQFKYVVYSRDLERRFQLTDNDIEPAPAYVAPQQGKQPYVPVSTMGAPTRGKLTRALDWARRRENRTIVVARRPHPPHVPRLRGLHYIQEQRRGRASPSGQAVLRGWWEQGSQEHDGSGRPRQQHRSEKVCQTYFIDQSFGLGFTRVLEYQLVKNGNSATVTATAPAQYVRGGREPYGTTVKVADVTLRVVNGKWVISKVVIGNY